MKFLERALKCFRRDQTRIDTYSLWGFGFRVPSPGNEIESPAERRANRNIRRIFQGVFDRSWQANRSMYVRMDDWTHAGEEDHLLSTTAATFPFEGRYGISSNYRQFAVVPVVSLRFLLIYPRFSNFDSVVILKNFRMIIMIELSLFWLICCSFQLLLQRGKLCLRNLLHQHHSIPSALF